MDAFARLDCCLRLVAGQGRYLLGKDACRIDDMACRDGHFLPGQHIAHDGTIELAIGTGKAGDLRIIGHDRPELGGSAQHGDCQLCIIGLRIVVQQCFFESSMTQLRHAP